MPRPRLSLSSSSRRHYLLLLAILLCGAFARFWNLEGLPNGSHGDEGIVGYEARRILEEGSIGPYSSASWGQPTGPIYLVAPFVWLWGNELYAVRFVPALVGTLSILALYGLVRPRLGRSVALISAFVLAFLTWHVHYARIAFPLESWPLASILILWALLAALEKPDWRRFALAGFLNGLGVYVYKAHPLFLLLSSVFGLVYLLRNREVDLKSKLAFPLVYTACALVAANFLIRFALQKDSGYGGQFAIASVFNSKKFRELEGDTSQQVLFLADRYLGFWKSVWGTYEIDWVDASGVVPLVPLGFFALFVVGFLRFKKADPLLVWSRVVVVLMPLAHVVTIEGFARRTFPLAPFLCVLAGLGALEILRFGAQKRLPGRILAPVVVAILLFLGAGQFARDYFSRFAADTRQAWVFCDELTQALRYAKTLPPQTPIYFYSKRWSIHYDTRKFLAPNLNATDCSSEYSLSQEEIWPTPPPGEKVVWIFLQGYEDRLARAYNDYPNGQIKIGPTSLSGIDGGPSFWAYEWSAPGEEPPIKPEEWDEDFWGDEFWGDEGWDEELWGEELWDEE